MRRLISILFVILSISQPLAAYDLKQAAIASAHPLATQAGLEILEQGGNAFDAAVTVSAVLAVVEPYSSGLGGGGFYLLHQVDEKEGHKNTVLDAREVAPLAADRDMYLSDQKRFQVKDATQGPKSAAIPGLPEALVVMAQKYGQLPLNTTLGPAIRLAREGFEVDQTYLEAASKHRVRLAQYSASKNFLPPEQDPSEPFRLVQKDLAKTLSMLADQGRAGFYEGAMAQILVEETQKAGGIWSLEDLKQYQIKMRKPLVGHFHDWTIITTPPPSAGGLSLLTALNLLKSYEEDPLSESDKIHLVIESLRRAYCDRAKYAGDPDFTHIPVGYLLSDAHIKTLKDSMDFDKATPSSSLQCGLPSSEKKQTSHFSIMDQSGNRVAATLTINGYFGSGYVVPGTGILLNNEMDDFSAKVGEANMYGLVGHASNLIAPQKRPVSSMMPTFIESKNGIGILGTPGGSFIPSMMLLAVLQADDTDFPPAWVEAPRYHHQYLPDLVMYEPEAFSKPVKNALRLRGHKLLPTGKRYGNMQLVYWDKKSHKMSAVSDSRGSGQGLVQSFESENSK